MKIKLDYLDNNIEFIDGYINVVEIENKKYFYRIINDLMQLNEGILEEVKVCDNHFKELNLTNKISIIIDYFNIDFNNKKIQNELNKKIISEADDKLIRQIINGFKQTCTLIRKLISNIDLPINVDDIMDINTLLKMIKISFTLKEDILDKLFLLIDIENLFKINKLLIFVNLKQYLSKEELRELYKYSIYKNVKILLIDSQNYGISNKYEKKLLIDDSLNEFVL